MLGMVEHGDGPCYVHMTGTDGFWRLRWLPRDDWSARASDQDVIDTVYVQVLSSALRSSFLGCVSSSVNGTLPPLSPQTIAESPM